jgi:hypothetical protein
MILKKLRDCIFIKIINKILYAGKTMMKERKTNA